MKLTIDTDDNLLIEQIGDHARTLPLYSDESFEIISRQWLKVGWNQKYSYTFSWMGLPIIQLPEDMVRIQEVIYKVKPDVIIETGIAHGGSLLFHASLCKAMGRGRVIGVDIEIRAANRGAIEHHDLASWVTLIEGSSTDPAIVRQVSDLVRSDETVIIILDSCHSKDHVLAELEAYAALVTPGSYIVATDGIMRDLSDVPRGQSDWVWDNPVTAAVEFSESHPEFELLQPEWPFKESALTNQVTHWPSAWLKRKG